MASSGSRNIRLLTRGGRHTQSVLWNSATVRLCTRRSISRILSTRQPGAANGFSGWRDAAFEAGIEEPATTPIRTTERSPQSRYRIIISTSSSPSTPSRPLATTAVLTVDCSIGAKESSNLRLPSARSFRMDCRPSGSWPQTGGMGDYLREVRVRGNSSSIAPNFAPCPSRRFEHPRRPAWPFRDSGNWTPPGTAPVQEA